MKTLYARSVIIFFLISVFIPARLSAINQQSLTDDEVRVRLDYIDSSLKHGEVGSRVWYWTFLGIYSVGTITQLSLYFAVDSLEHDPVKAEYTRQDLLMGTITTALGALNLGIFPMTSMYARNSYLSMPETTLDEKIMKLKKAETMIATSARWESDNNSLLIHGLNFGINLAAGLIIWLAFNRTILDGLITFLPGFAIGEIQIFTQPTGAIRDWKKYDEKYISKISNNYKKADDNLWHVAAAPGGLMIIREF